MRQKLRKLVLKESMQIGPTATTSIDVEDPNMHRRMMYKDIAMELDDSTGLVTVVFRQRAPLWVHMSAARYAEGFGAGIAGAAPTHTVTRYDPNKLDDDDSQAAYLPPRTVAEAVSLDDDIDETPAPAPSPVVEPAVKRGRGRPRKVVAVADDTDDDAA